MSPVSTKTTADPESSQKKDSQIVLSGDKNINILSKTMKNTDKIIGKTSATIEGNSYNSIISHQSKSFSNTKGEKSINSIINSKSIITKKSKDGSGVSPHS